MTRIIASFRNQLELLKAPLFPWLKTDHHHRLHRQIGSLLADYAHKVQAANQSHGNDIILKLSLVYGLSEERIELIHSNDNSKNCFKIK
jgi:hypothetical protein